MYCQQLYSIRINCFKYKVTTYIKISSMHRCSVTFETIQPKRSINVMCEERV